MARVLEILRSGRRHLEATMGRIPHWPVPEGVAEAMAEEVEALLTATEAKALRELAKAPPEQALEVLTEACRMGLAGVTAALLDLGGEDLVRDPEAERAVYLAAGGAGTVPCRVRAALGKARPPALREGAWSTRGLLRLLAERPGGAALLARCGSGVLDRAMVQTQDPRVIGLLLDAGISMDPRKMLMAQHQWQPGVDTVARRVDVEVVAMALDRGAVQVEEIVCVCREGRILPAAHVAMRLPELLPLFVKHRVNLETKYRGLTAVHEAVMRRNWPVACALYDEGACVEGLTEKQREAVERRWPVVVTAWTAGQTALPRRLLLRVAPVMLAHLDRAESRKVYKPGLLRRIPTPVLSRVLDYVVGSSRFRMDGLRRQGMVAQSKEARPTKTAAPAIPAVCMDVLEN